MFKRYFTLMLTIVLFSVQAQAQTHEGLKEAFIELNYSLTTEWDQKDLSFFNAQSEKFTSKLRTLQQQGLSQQDMLQTIMGELKDQRLARDVQGLFNLVSINMMDPDEAQKQLKVLVDKSYNRGASWNGTSFLLGGVFVVALAALLVVLNQEKLESTAQECYMAYKCNQYCGPISCEQVCGNECI